MLFQSNNFNYKIVVKFLVISISIYLLSNKKNVDLCKLYKLQNICDFCTNNRTLKLLNPNLHYASKPGLTLTRVRFWQCKCLINALTLVRPIIRGSNRGSHIHAFYSLHETQNPRNERLFPFVSQVLYNIRGVRRLEFVYLIKHSRSYCK